MVDTASTNKLNISSLWSSLRQHVCTKDANEYDSSVRVKSCCSLYGCGPSQVELKKDKNINKLHPIGPES